MLPLETPLAQVLLRPIVDCAATRRYYAMLDVHLDRLIADGALGPEPIYRTGEGRAGTAPLCNAAFAWASPLSRYHHDARLLDFFRDGFTWFVDSIDEQGGMGRYGLNGEVWAHGWDVEGLIYGLYFTYQALPPELVQRALTRFRLSAKRHAEQPRTPGAIGSYGNQRTVWTLGLYLYGQLLGEPAYLRLADQYFRDDALDKVLDAGGQVIEQQGPCLHYSYTAFIYSWLNLVVTGDTGQQARIARNLAWFHQRFTADYTPIAGPSTRRYLETLPDCFGDLLPAAEQLAASDPSAREWVRAGLDRRPAPAPGAFPASNGHGASVLMWAILMCPGDAPATAAQRAAWDAPCTAVYDYTNLLKRFPLKYVLVRRRYQTHHNHRDYLPFSGIQTWAWGGEPPLIHPTPLYPSTTQGWGLDTARQGASHNWGLFGAGAVGVDGYVRQPKQPDELPLLVARYDWLWRLVVFTDRATVLFEWGEGGPRRTAWTLNRNAPAEPTLAPGVVTFAGRTGRLYTTLPGLPGRRRAPEDHEWARGVEQLVYDCPGGRVGFAFADETFRFLDRLRFADGDGVVEVVLHPDWGTRPNPGNLAIDPWQFTHGSVARRLPPPGGN
jgi:hypothetical protein